MNAVSVEHIDGQWAVRIVENGEIIQRLFEEEQFARNFAAGQRLRLGLPAMDASEPRVTSRA